ncbi:MAG: cupredoxin domain-containing protein [Nitrososphaerales archaeon]
MDKDLYYISLFLIFIGAAGQLTYYFFALHGGTGGGPTQASFQEIENVTGYALLLGLLILPAGLLKDGLPAPGHTAKVLIGVILIVCVGLSFTAVLLNPSAQAKGPVAHGFVTILLGSQNSQPITSTTFSPRNVTVIIGTNNTVMWTNRDVATHTVTSASVPTGAVSFNSGLISPSGTFTYTFTVPGRYVYYCTLHSWMQATIIVKSG